MKKTDWCLEIIRVQGGYKLRFDVDGEDYLDESVIQDGDDKLKSGEELLWFVMDHFFLRGSKHDEQRLCVCLENRDGTLDFQGETYVAGEV